MSARRPWISLWRYEADYGSLDYAVPDTRTDPRSCLWCHGALPNKRRKTFCCSKHEREWQKRYVFNRNRGPVAWRILCRDNFACKDCGEAMRFTNEHGVEMPTPAGLDVHHIVPVSGGGTDHEGNLVTMCKACHLARHGKRAKGNEQG